MVQKKKNKKILISTQRFVKRIKIKAGSIVIILFLINFINSAVLLPVFIFYRAIFQLYNIVFAQSHIIVKIMKTFDT